MFTEVNGLQIHYLREGHGEKVLLLHGWGTGVKLYENLIAHLSPHFDVVALEFPGCGESDEPKSPLTLTDYVDLVIEFCHAIDFHPSTVFAHSHGGRTLIKLLGTHPEFTIQRAVLIGSAGIVPKKSLKSKIKVICYKAGKRFLSLKPIKTMFPNALENLRNRSGSADYRAASPVMRATLVNVVNESVAHLLPLVSVPTLLIWGENDDQTPLSDALQMEKLIPDAGLVTLKNAGHFVFLEQQAAFFRIIDSFLNI